MQIKDRVRDFTISGNLSLSATTKIEGNLVPDAADLRTLGSSSARWTTVYVSENSVELFSTATNCSDSAGAAACGSAAAGSVVVDAGSTSVVVSTTAVTANSQIIPVFDSSLGTRLGVTCNTTAVIPFVTSRTAGTSFTITVSAAPITNPACLSFLVIN